MSELIDVHARFLLACDLIETGIAKTRACAQVGISPATYAKYSALSPELKELAENAAIRGREALAERLLYIDSDQEYGSTNPAMASVKSGNIKWLLARQDPEAYGDKVQIKTTITADRAVIEALQRGKERAAIGVVDRSGAIDAEFFVVPDELADFMRSS